MVWIFSCGYSHILDCPYAAGLPCFFAEERFLSQMKGSKDGECVVFSLFTAPDRSKVLLLYSIKHERMLSDWGRGDTRVVRGKAQ